MLPRARERAREELKATELLKLSIQNAVFSKEDHQRSSIRTSITIVDEKTTAVRWKSASNFNALQSIQVVQHR